MKFAWWTGLGLAALAAVLFAVTNRQPVSIGLWPLPFLIEMPLYLVLLGALLLGFVAGELVAWLAGFHWRREARRSRDRIAALEKQLAEARPRIAPPP